MTNHTLLCPTLLVLSHTLSLFFFFSLCVFGYIYYFIFSHGFTIEGLPDIGLFHLITIQGKTVVNSDVQNYILRDFPSFPLYDQSFNGIAQFVAIAT